jgi:hypothetical protein
MAGVSAAGLLQSGVGNNVAVGASGNGLLVAVVTSFCGTGEADCGISVACRVATAGLEGARLGAAAGELIGELQDPNRNTAIKLKHVKRKM